MIVDSEVALTYELLVQERKRGVPDLLLPADHAVNWDDAPLRYTIHTELPEVALSSHPLSLELPLIDMSDPNAEPAEPQPLTIENISALLLLTWGVLRRKLTMHWNDDSSIIPRHDRMSLSRGTASGGGLYPVEIYVVKGHVQDFPAGVYHYNSAHHSLARLRAGDFHSVLASASRQPAPNDAALSIIFNVRFWKNYFKYLNFGYRVVTTDVGTAIAAIQQVAAAFGWTSSITYWFQDSLLRALLGLDESEEGTFAIMTIQPTPAGSTTREAVNETDQRLLKHDSQLSSIRASKLERSKTIFAAQMFSTVHQSTLLDEVTRTPALQTQAAASAQPSHRLSRTPIPRLPLKGIFQDRETAWGRFRREPALDLDVLAQILAFTACSVSSSTDLYADSDTLPCVRLAIIGQSVKGLPVGAYDYLPSTHHLASRGAFVPALGSLQDIYFLDNYNLDQVAAIIVVISRYAEVFEQLHDRGIRVLNAECGITVQRAYMASVAVGVGCGAVAGFDAQQINQRIWIDGNKESAAALILLGNQPRAANAYDFRIY